MHFKQGVGTSPAIVQLREGWLTALRQHCGLDMKRVDQAFHRGRHAMSRYISLYYIQA